MSNRRDGFTLVELLVVLAIMATLMSIVVPRYFHAVDKAKEATLKTNLRTIRDSIDRYRADRGNYPNTLNDLVQERYIRDLPVDPITDRSDTWILSPSPNASVGGIYDVHSGAQGEGSDGRPFSQW